MVVRTRITRSKPRAASIEFGAQICEIDASITGRVSIQTAQGAGEQRDGSGTVAVLEVVEGGGDLDEGLEEVFLRLREGEPDGLPMLVSEEEFAAVKAGESFGEGGAGPVERQGVEGHGMIIADSAGFHWSGKSVKMEAS